ncbi:MAG: hypothetical protein RI930_197 [Pseudomonadota bacterium]|jgi:predicted house-cleaning noncanonical NTP pyrophosphatase (MazG superfamily)
MKKFKNAYEKYNFQINKITEIKEIFDINCIKAELATILNLPGKKNIEDDFYEIIGNLRKEIAITIKEKQDNKSFFENILSWEKNEFLSEDQLNQIKNATESLKEKTQSIKNFVSGILKIAKQIKDIGL